MLYLAIDQHAKQITVCVRNEEGEKGCLGVQSARQKNVASEPENNDAISRIEDASLPLLKTQRMLCTNKERARQEETRNQTLDAVASFRDGPTDAYDLDLDLAAGFRKFDDAAPWHCISQL